METYLAIDLGAESGRGVVGTFDGDRLRLDEAHRFPNGPVRLFDHLYWDGMRLFAEIKTAIAKASHAAGAPLRGMAIDTWGVDFGLVGPDGTLLSEPRSYRDPRTDGMMERAETIVSRREIFQATGIQFLQFNTLYQLLALSEREPRLLEAADKLLLMGELFTYFLTGEAAAEFTNASTTQLMTPDGRWAKELFDRFQLPMDIMPSIVQPGTRVGSVLASVMEELGLKGELPVYFPAVHDTGSAVVGVPAAGENWAFISSGTWSLVGMEVASPVVTDDSLAFNLTNEGGAGGTHRLLKNVMGLWILQELRREWERGGEALTYDQLTKIALEAAPSNVYVDPDDPSFFAPGDMAARIQSFAVQTGQPEPKSLPELVRCVLESLALKYRYVIERLEQATGKKVDVVHIVGGGSRNDALNQMTADASGRRVVAGPQEATAIGNLVMQAVGSGALPDIAAGRHIIRNSFALKTFEPQRATDWEKAYERFLAAALR